MKQNIINKKKQYNGGERPTIALVSTPVWSWPLGLSMMDGLADASLEENVNFVCFQGPYDPSSKNPANLVFDMIDKSILDGIVIFGSSLSSRIGLKEMLELCERLRPLPIVSIGSSYPGIPGIIIESYREMFEAVSHLIEIHHCRQIAFLQGPKDHYDSEERFRAYCDALIAHHIPVKFDLITPNGLWDPDRIPADIQYLLDHNPKNFDAIITPNDNLAFSAIEELERRGFKIPEDIAVIGNNDEPLGTRIATALTTSNIKIYERAYLAVKTLLELIEGKTVPEQQSISSELIIRRSCGCPSPAVTLANLPQQTSGYRDPKVPLKETVELYRDALIAKVVQTIKKPSPVNIRITEELMDAFILELGAESQERFIILLEKILSGNITFLKNIAPKDWLNTLLTFRRELAPFLNQNELIKAENLWCQAQVIFAETTELATLERQLDTAEKYWELNRFNQKLSSTFDLPQLLEMIGEYLVKLDFSTFFLSIFESPKEDLTQARLLLARTEAGRINLDGDGLIFSLPELFPAALLDSQSCYSLILVPLYYETNRLGYILLDRIPFFMNGIIYNSLQIQLSNALWGTLLFHKQKQTEMALRENAVNLTRSNNELRQFAYLASHDLQEPLRKITVFCGRLKASSSNFNGPELDYVERMHKAASRMQQLVNDLLTFSQVTIKAQPFIAVDLNQTGAEVISDLEYRLNQTRGRVELGILPTIKADPLQMRQLFQNLINNGLKFHRENVPPVVKIYATIHSSEIVICFEDNGIGIESSYFEKIFVLFERLHGRNEFEGSGIGLAICKKIVDRHGGTIHIESVLGVGSKFFVKLPIQQ
ncbi:MAG TPA: substrate-binding domain-containing protein [Bacillota bacterium]|nr:substrate-binding domain-containing protein [Bacillota bacterium]